MNFVTNHADKFDNNSIISLEKPKLCLNKKNEINQVSLWLKRCSDFHQTMERILAQIRRARIASLEIGGEKNQAKIAPRPHN